jgi:hypothetical protein
VSRTSSKSRVYTVVDVQAGVAVGAHSFSRMQDATAYVKNRRSELDFDEDCVKIFVCYPMSKEGHTTRSRKFRRLAAAWTSDRRDSLVEQIVR